jgi:hypothetical protein
MNTTWQSVNGEGASVEADSTHKWQEQLTPTNHYVVYPKGHFES